MVESSLSLESRWLGVVNPAGLHPDQRDSQWQPGNYHWKNSALDYPMSVEVMATVWMLDLPSNEKLVLLGFADHANDDGVCYPSIRRVAWKCGFSERQVQRIVSDLKQSKLLRVTVGPSDRLTTTYRITTGGGVKLSPFKAKGVTPMTEGGDVDDAQGVTPMSPESSVETINEPSSIDHLEESLKDLNPNTRTTHSYDEGVFKNYKRDFGRVAGITPKADVKGLYRSVCRLRGEQNVLGHIEDWVGRHGGQMALRKDKWAAKNFLTDCKAELGARAGMVAMAAAEFHGGTPTRLRMTNIEIPREPSTEESWENFRAEFYKCSGSLPIGNKTSLELYATAVRKHGEDAVLDLIPGWVEQHGGYETLATQEWCGANFLRDVEIMLTTEVRRGSDTRSRDGSVDARDLPLGYVSPEGQAVYAKYSNKNKAKPA